MKKIDKRISKFLIPIDGYSHLNDVVEYNKKVEELRRRYFTGCDIPDSELEVMNNLYINAMLLIEIEEKLIEEGEEKKN